MFERAIEAIVIAIALTPEIAIAIAAEIITAGATVAIENRSTVCRSAAMALRECGQRRDWRTQTYDEQ
jgi:hypothetical protein